MNVTSKQQVTFYKRKQTKAGHGLDFPLSHTRECEVRPQETSSYFLIP